MKTFFISLRMFLVMTVLTGVLYPLLVTGIGHAIFGYASHGSLIVLNNQPLGSELIGQQFTDARYFSGRPSAINYNPLPSGGSNLALTSVELRANVERNKHRFDSVNQLLPSQKVPSEMLYASGSGLDPHISPQSALLQVNRICIVRRLPVTAHRQIETMIAALTEKRQFGFLGEERVNVLKLNIELDRVFK